MSARYTALPRALPVWALACSLLLTALLHARADLVLANFNAAHPIKIMAVGDSITDDCSFNGAWRLYLQPLLEAKGYPFTFVGRAASTPSGSFTKVRHEGYCGSVIAAPGLYAGPVHGYSGTNVYLQRIVADAFTNAIPDLALLLIGANDIGRGRNPYQVATNDMPKLLDLILSNAPNANIILAKITTLLNGNIGSPTYGAYATNVLIYNSALQAMVNRRRAQGQNVFLADCYSAVDYNTMFTSDHVHPNQQGHAAMASEWLSRIQAITVGGTPLTTTLIHGGDSWKFSDTGQDLGTNWAQMDFDDSGWSSGPARLGYGEPSVATIVSYGGDPAHRYITTYFRRPIVVPPDVVYTNLNFRLARVEGAAVWLNGQEIFRTNVPSGPLSYTNLALGVVGLYGGHIFYPTNIVPVGLTLGTNLVALELHQSSPARSMLGMDMELLGIGYTVPPPTLAIVRSGVEVVLSWPLATGSGYTLFSAPSAALGPWAASTAPLQTNVGQITAAVAPEGTVRFFRLQRP